MKIKAVVFLTLLIGFSGHAFGRDFLGAPVMPEGKPLKKTETRLEMSVERSHDEVVAFYREALKSLKDIKFREWKDATYIEDDGNLDWHSITVSKDDQIETKIIIMKDNWTWIIGTLVLRFIGVFVVLLFLMLGMVLSGAIISRSLKGADQKAS